MKPITKFALRILLGDFLRDMGTSFTPDAPSHQKAVVKFFENYEKASKDHGLVPSDTKRLDWLLNHPGADWDFYVESKSRIWQVIDATSYIKWFSESEWRIVRGKDWRECIDNAIANKFEII